MVGKDVEICSNDSYSKKIISNLKETLSDIPTKSVLSGVIMNEQLQITDESYRLVVTPDTVELSSSNEFGMCVILTPRRPLYADFFSIELIILAVDGIDIIR